MHFYGLKPNVKLMKKHWCKFVVGTDNAMLNSPNILDEIKFIKKQFQKNFQSKNYFYYDNLWCKESFKSGLQHSWCQFQG